MVPTSIFRGLDEEFFNKLKAKGSSLNFILDYERRNRGILIVEIRNNFLDLYFLGHAIEVRRSGKVKKYSLIGANQFKPSNSFSSDRISRIVKDYGPLKWQISFDDIEAETDFQEIMDTIISRIVIHKKGAISEGISEINHLVDNRDIGQNGILIIDRQVIYPGDRKRIDLLGAKRLSKGGKFTFAIIELKNKNNVEIDGVFSQIRDYIDIIFNNYADFVKTYSQIIRQKQALGLLKRMRIEFAEKEEIIKTDINGIVILDNFNVKGDLRKNGLFRRALNDWIKDNNYCLKLFLKTNVLDSTFFLDYPSATAMLDNFLEKNRPLPV